MRGRSAHPSQWPTAPAGCPSGNISLFQACGSEWRPARSSPRCMGIRSSSWRPGPMRRAGCGDGVEDCLLLGGLGGAVGTRGRMHLRAFGLVSATPVVRKEPFVATGRWRTTAPVGPATAGRWGGSDGQRSRAAHGRMARCHSARRTGSVRREKVARWRRAGRLGDFGPPRRETDAVSTAGAHRPGAHPCHSA